MLALYFMFLVLPAMNILLKSALASLFITALEFMIGLVVNLIMGLNIWDYSKVPLNLLGQICLPFSGVWMGLSFAMFNIFTVAQNLLLTINV